MLSPIYISHASAIAPQNILSTPYFSPLLQDENIRLNCVEPNYTEIIPPMQLRRMSRLLRMGMYTAVNCLEQAKVTCPDNIITTTGKGNMTDTEKFVKELKIYNEQALNPTPFILSTYNALNGAIALQKQSLGYNQTFVHRGSSFESGLYDAQLRLNESATPQNVLLGSFDEITDEYMIVKDKIGYWKNDRDTQLSLWQQQHTKGSIAGEGAAFFMLHNKPQPGGIAIKAVKTFIAYNDEAVKQNIESLLNSCHCKHDDIDMMIAGYNGDVNDAKWYDDMIQYINPDMPVMVFKHLCGEYETAGSFALWLLYQLLKKEKLPYSIWYNQNIENQPKTILYYNHFRGLQHNLILLSISE